jgi:hypothetical protein
LNSELGLRVLAFDASDPKSEGALLGQTPAAGQGVHIPAGLCWYVGPVDRAIADSGLQPLGCELLRLSIPGLSLRGCSKVSDTGLFHLSLALPGLRFLDLTGTRGTPRGLSAFRDPALLQTLIFQDLEAARGELLPLSTQWALQHLDLSRLHAPRTTRWDQLRGQTWEAASLLELSSLSHLQWLGLREVRLCEDDFAAIEGFPGLQTLDLRGAEVDAPLFARLRALPLRELLA